MASTTTLNFDLFARDHASSTFRNFGSAVGSSTSSVGKLKLGLGSLVRGFVALGAVYKTVDFFKQSVSEASDLNESLNAVNVTFGKNAAGVKNLGRQAAESMGLSNSAFNGLAVQFSAFATTIAGKGGNVVGTLKGITGRAADFASVMNIDVAEAARLFQSGLAGETEPLRKFGIDLSAAAVEAFAFKKGIAESGATLTEQQKVQARYGLLMKSTAKTQGDFRNTSDGLANSQRILSAQWDNMQAKVGTALLPVLAKLTTWGTTTLIPWIETTYDWLKQKLGPVFSSVAGWFSGASAEGGKLSTAFAGLVDAGKRLYEALKPVAIDIFEAIKRNWPQIKATVTDVLNSVSATVKAFAELVTTVWDKWGDDIMQATGRVWQHVGTQIKSALRVIQGIIQVVTGIIKGDWSQVWDGLKNIVGGAVDSIKGYVRNLVGNAKQALSGLGSALKSIITGAWDKAKDATVTGIGKVVHWVSTLPTKIKRAIGNLGQLLYEAGRDVIQGLIDGVQSKLGELADTMGNVVTGLKGAVTSGLGIFSPSKVMHKIGEQTMQGLIDGLDSKIANLRSKMAEITGTIKGSFTSPFDQGGSTALDLRAGANTNLQQATQFRNDLRKLTSKGVSDAVLNQLIGSGNFAAIHDLANSSRHEIDVLDRRTAATNRMLNQASNIAQNALGRDRLQSLLDQKRNLTDAVEDGFTRALDKRPGHRRQASRDLIRGAV